MEWLSGKRLVTVGDSLGIIQCAGDEHLFRETGKTVNHFFIRMDAVLQVGVKGNNFRHKVLSLVHHRIRKNLHTFLRLCEDDTCIIPEDELPDIPGKLRIQLTRDLFEIQFCHHASSIRISQ